MGSKRLINNLSELIDFLAYVSVYAPDEFPREDEGVNLESAFSELFHGLEACGGEVGNESISMKCEQMLQDAKQSYMDGEVHAGTELLQRLQKTLRGE